jgi:PleD family two-component response regulator
MEVISTSDWMEHSERSEFTALEDDIRAPTILVVDDDDFVRDAVSLVLSGEGSELLHARSGEEAISLIGTHSTLDGL